MSKTRPILFNGDMVRAILNGQKTQTRRAVKNLTVYPDRWVWQTSKSTTVSAPVGEIWGCPYGIPGDRLWVRETFATEKYGTDTVCAYRASCPDDLFDFVHWNGEIARIHVDRWKPSLHMPRWASRILLEVVSVRVERLTDISEADVKAEGMIEGCKDGCLIKYGLPSWAWRDYRSKFCHAFKDLWDSVASPGTDWSSNPWVWVIEFKRVEK